VLGTGCAEKSTAPAATVNGTTVTTKDVVDELDAINANPDYRTDIDNQFKQQGQAVVGSAPGTYDAAFVGQVLLRQMQFTLTHDEVVRRNLQASDDCRVAAQNDLIQNLGGGDVQKGQSVLAAFPEGYRNRLVGWYIDEWMLQSDLVQQPCGGSEVGKAYFDAHPDDFVQMCVSVITAGDENTANNVVEQARAGADFTSLARQYSTASDVAQTGGDAGCLFPVEINTLFQQTLQQTPTGSVTDPVSNNQGGYLVFKVTDRKPAAFSDVSSQAEQLAARDQAVEYRGWLTHALQDAKITVDPRYGTYDAENLTITPPATESSSSSPSTDPSVTGSDGSPTPGP
jgi:hypothetical protein